MARYKYDSVHEWFYAWLERQTDSHHIANLLAEKLDADTLQDLFQSNMDADGYFRDLDAPPPNVEVFYMSASEFANAGEDTWMRERMEEEDRMADADSLAGWYWWNCFPGCLPDSDAVGPFNSREAAIADAQDIE